MFFCRFLRSESGASIVEYAIIAIVLTLVLCSVTDGLAAVSGRMTAILALL